MISGEDKGMKMVESDKRKERNEMKNESEGLCVRRYVTQRRDRWLFDKWRRGKKLCVRAEVSRRVKLCDEGEGGVSLKLNNLMFMPLGYRLP